MSGCAPQCADICIIRGNNHPPVKWQFLCSENPDVLMDMTGSIFKLEVDWPGGGFNLATDDGSGKLTVDAVNSILIWQYSVSDSHSIPQGKIASYEIERWIAGTQQDFIAGDVIARAGNNPD